MCLYYIVSFFGNKCVTGLGLCNFYENCMQTFYPVSSKISDLCEISDLSLFFSYFASESKGIKFCNYFFDICCAN